MTTDMTRNTVEAIYATTVDPEAKALAQLRYAEQWIRNDTDASAVSLYDDAKSADDGVSDRMARNTFASRFGNAKRIVEMVGLSDAGNPVPGKAFEFVSHWNVENGSDIWSLQNASLRKACGIGGERSAPTLPNLTEDEIAALESLTTAKRVPDTVDVVEDAATAHKTQFDVAMATLPHLTKDELTLLEYAIVERQDAMLQQLHTFTV